MRQLSDVEIEERNRKITEQKKADLDASILFCLSDDKVKPVIKFLLDTTMVMEPIAAGQSHSELLEVVTLQRVGNMFLKVLMEASPELTGKLLTNIEKDRQNEAFYRNQQSE